MARYLTDRNKHINNSINIFKLICAFLVVAIHTHPFSDINSTLGFISTDVLTRIAVPFFFIVSGYYYYEKINSDLNAFWPYIKKILETYCIWSCIYFILNAITMLKDRIFNIKSYIADCVTRFFFLGPYYHLWYIPSLLIGICLMTFFKKINFMKGFCVFTVFLYVVGVLSCAYAEISAKITLLSSLNNFPYYDSIRKAILMGIPFFTAGFIVHYLRSRVKNVGLGVALFGILTVAEIFLVLHMKWGSNIVITFALYPFTIFVLLFLLKHPYSSMKGSSLNCRKFSGFVYYAHPLVIVFLNCAVVLPETLLFVLVCLVCVAFGIAIIKIGNKYLMKLL